MQFFAGDRRGIVSLPESAVVVALGILVALGTTSSWLVAVASGGAAVLLVLGLVNTELFVTCAFATVAMPRLHLPGTQLPLNEMLLGMTFVVLVVAGRSAERRSPAWLTVPLGGLFASLVFSMLVNGAPNADSMRRLAHVGLFVMVSIGVANGFIPFRALVRGLVLGTLCACCFGFLALGTGIGAGTYTGRLTGLLFGEPNFAGFLLAVMCPIVAFNIRRAGMRHAFIVVAAIALVLTFSRTSFLAVGLGLVWVFLGRRVQPALALAILAILIGCVALVPAEIHAVGPFSTRLGSDQLRTRILDLETLSIRQSPVLGHGPGTASVELPGHRGFRFYFHSSYFALVQEGGLVALVVMAVLLVTLFFKLTALATRDRSPLLEVSIIALTVCAITLGEVLLEMLAALALGAAARHILLAGAARHARDGGGQASLPLTLDA